MQVLRLVMPGIVDRMIAFNSLPQRLIKGIRRGGIEGFPRHWKDFMGVKATEINPQPFYFLEYTILNADKERWQEISNYVRAVVDKEFRLLDKLEDMAKSLAPDSYTQMTLEPEDILIIPIPAEEEKKPKESAKLKKENDVKTDQIKADQIKTDQMKTEYKGKKRGRPRKEVAAVKE